MICWVGMSGEAYYLILSHGIGAELSLEAIGVHRSLVFHDFIIYLRYVAEIQNRIAIAIKMYIQIKKKSGIELI